jgi:carbon storage regulator CsrA
MLVLTRKPGEKVYIGKDISLTVLEVKGNRIRIGIDAPAEIPVARAELGNPLARLAPISKAEDPNRATSRGNKLQGAFQRA